MATIMTKDSPTQMATVRPGVFKVPAARPGADRARSSASRSSSTRTDVGLEADAGRVVRHARSPSATRRSSWPAATASARGPTSTPTSSRWPTGLGRLLGASTKVAASRMAVEDGFTTHDYQVGQTGQTVQPRLYVAIGISGAVQHITGMQGSEIVVAINKDPKARIFNYADFGVVGDIETVVPELVRATEGRA